MIKGFLEYCQVYINNLGILKFGIVKTCIFAFGMLIGMAIPSKNKKCYFTGLGLVFVTTYLYIIADFLGFDKYFKAHDEDEDFDWID